MNRKSAIAAIDKAGALLVFPLDNRPEPPSIWSHFRPREKMKWEWDDDGDDHVVKLWHLRAELSTTRKVVYTKWFRNRATYFSFPVFRALLRALNPQGPGKGLSENARRILSILDGESPLSTKEIKRLASLQGRAHEATYEKALRELWARCLIVAFGEVDDGAFPSLAIGSTRVIFETLWNEAQKLEPLKARQELVRGLPSKSLFLKHFEKLRKDLPSAPARAAAKTAPAVVRFEDL